ncbi:MAG: M23 family metallopeptidase [Candidatus Andersenbacteria bacterium]
MARSRQAEAPVLIEEPASHATPTVTPLLQSPQPAAVPLLTAPITSPEQRVSKKPFGIHITPATSPVLFDIFNGYHTGVDFEVFENELPLDVEISAVCSGPLIFKGWITGYGGVAVQQCQLEEQTVTIVYGHLNLATIIVSKGDMIAPGERIGALGQGFSSETDGQRKHLHLGIHKGAVVNVQGYVDTKSALEEWVNILDYALSSLGFVKSKRLLLISQQVLPLQ